MFWMTVYINKAHSLRNNSTFSAVFIITTFSFQNAGSDFNQPYTIIRNSQQYCEITHLSILALMLKEQESESKHVGLQARGPATSCLFWLCTCIQGHSLTGQVYVLWRHQLPLKVPISMRKLVLRHSTSTIETKSRRLNCTQVYNFH